MAGERQLTFHFFSCCLATDDTISLDLESPSSPMRLSALAEFVSPAALFAAPPVVQLLSAPLDPVESARSRL